MRSVPAAASGREMDAQVAARLFLSISAVDHHVANLLAKTGATGRAELQRLVAGWEFPQPAGHAGAFRETWPAYRTIRERDGFVIAGAGPSR